MGKIINQNNETIIIWNIQLQKTNKREISQSQKENTDYSENKIKIIEMKLNII